MLTQSQLIDVIPNALKSVELDKSFGTKITGKVRDIYHHEGNRVLIATDRVSAFDRILGLIPYRGQVLNQLSAWWFEQTKHIVKNHVLVSPDPNVTIAKEAQTIPVEVVVRGYITGVTGTSMWTMYANGEREPYGIALPEGLQKNDKLPTAVITPTTKAADGGHDERLTRDEILERKIVAPELWEQIETTALALFAHGQKVAESAGLILVDTKYEFGLIDGQLTLIDEIHTPDSSRYWIKDTYGKEGQDPEHFDKEFLRLWFAGQGYTGEGTPPTMPPEFIAKVAERYISAFERLTGETFKPASLPADERITSNLKSYIET